MVYEYNVVNLFEAISAQSPKQTAVIHQDVEHTYIEINQRANQFARWLENKDISKDDYVGILLEPGVDFIICILAIIKTGAAYIPLDTLAPETRLNEIIFDAKPKIIITSELFHNKIQSAKLIKDIHLESISLDCSNLNYTISPEFPMYMMYTSGSTGKPKGVVIPHRAVVNLAYTQNDINIKPQHKMAQFSNLAFDGSTFDIWAPLLHEATLIILSNEERTDPHQLKQALDKHHVDLIFLPTSFLHQIVKSFPDTLNTVHTVLFGGEQINETLISVFLAYRKQHNIPITLINGYGPTEATGYVCRKILFFEKENQQLACIGTPIKNVQLYILDENLNHSKEGELFISGASLALKYNDAETTASKFIQNPFNQSKNHRLLYRTGDKVRQLSNGEILWLERMDDQVKIGGFRIHLNEIEAHLTQHPNISLAVLGVEEGFGSHKMLTAYIVPTDSKTEIRADSLRDYLSQKIPIYMLPTKYVMVDKLPLTQTGKIDKTKLSSIPHIDLSILDDHISNDLIELKIIQIWQKLLNRKHVNPNTNLFDIGANSLLITEACTHINQELSTELKVTHLISYPSIRKLSRYIQGNIRQTNIKEHKFTSSKIAIVGMACKFPKANSVEEFWKNLCEGKDCLDRFEIDTLEDSEDPTYVPVRGTISDVEYFDASFFGFNPHDAKAADPQHRLFMECAWEALENAGVAPNKYQDKTISVFSGMTDSTYLYENLLKNSQFRKESDYFQQRIATSMGMLSTQVSYRLNLKGRSINVNTACSTGLITVEQACQDLVLGQSDIAVAGAVSIALPQNKGYYYQMGSILSSDGCCRPFSAKANGTVFSNGVGIVVLKRLEDAIADKNTIYAVIQGTGANNDGSDKLGYTAPSTNGQISCIKDALQSANLSPEQISFIETHGTGTDLGDAIEIEALTSVYNEKTTHKNYCAIGSCKANIGHTDVTAGIASLIKTTLCLYHKKIPPLIHYEPNNKLALQDTPFYVNTTLIDWKLPENKDLRYAGVSSFGFGGTNSHFILSEFNPLDKQYEEKETEHLFILSAKNPIALQHNRDNLINYLQKNIAFITPFEFGNIAFTLQTGRDDFDHRTYAVGHNPQALIMNLSKAMISSTSDTDELNHIVYMFPGQGSLYKGMTKELMQCSPLFALWMNQGADLTKKYLDCDLLNLIYHSSNDALLDTKYAQIIIFIIEYALTQLLLSLGIKPGALIGHSLGEYVAATVAGVFSFEDAIAVICERGILMSRTPKGQMLSIECTEVEFSQYCKNTDVEFSVHNSPYHFVAGGRENSILQLEQALKKDKKNYQKLPVTHAFHSSFMDSIELPFKDLLSKIQLNPPTIPIVSNVTGSWLSAHEAMDPNYWYQHLRKTVQFKKSLELLIKDKHSIFLEVGPGPILTTLLRATAKEHGKNVNATHILPNHHRLNTDSVQLYDAVGYLWQKGTLHIKWDELHKTNQNRQYISLPTYSFQKQKYWIDVDTFQEKKLNALFKPTWSIQPSYTRNNFSNQELSEYQWIIFKNQSNDVTSDILSYLSENKVNFIVAESATTYLAHNKCHYLIDISKKEDFLSFFNSIEPTSSKIMIINALSLSENAFGSIEGSRLDELLNSSFYSLLYISQCIASQNTSVKLINLTCGTHKVLGNESISPVNACLLGASQVIAQEIPQIQIRNIDLDINTDLDQKKCSNALIKFIMQPNIETQDVIPFRNGYFWEKSYAPISLFSNQYCFQDRDIFLITGGTSAIVLKICETISKTIKNPTFILLSRTRPIQPTKWDLPEYESDNLIMQLKKLCNLGALIDWKQTDITNYEQLKLTINKIKKKYIRIDGILHAAGIPSGEMIQTKTKDTAKSVLAPKVNGTYNLSKALDDSPLKFVILFSSLSSIVGICGQFDYSAANACLDAFANSTFFNSNFITSINWNSWHDLGMTAENETSNRLNIFKLENYLSIEEGQKLFLNIARCNSENIIVSKIEIEQFRQFVSENAHKIYSHELISRDTLNIGINYQEPENSQERKLAWIWQQNLNINQIGRHDNFFEMGGHSLKALNLLNEINNKFNASLEIKDLYNAPTIAQFSKTLESNSKREMQVLIPIKTLHNAVTKIFFCHPAIGFAYCFNSLVPHWNLPVEIYGLQDPSISHQKLIFNSILEMAKHYLDEIQAIQPKGPYFLAGYSFGGTVMYEIANLLKNKGESVNLLALIESWCVFSDSHSIATHFKQSLKNQYADLDTKLIDMAWSRMELLLRHSPSKMSQNIILFKATEILNEYKLVNQKYNGWDRFNSAQINVKLIESNHDTILNNESIQIIIKEISQLIHL